MIKTRDDLLSVLGQYNEVVLTGNLNDWEPNLNPCEADLVTSTVSYLHNQGRRVMQMSAMAFHYFLKDVWSEDQIGNDFFLETYFGSLDLLVLDTAEYLMNHQDLIPMIRHLVYSPTKLLLVTSIPFNTNPDMERELAFFKTVYYTAVIPYHDMKYPWLNARGELFHAEEERNPVETLLEKVGEDKTVWVLMSNYLFLRDMDQEVARNTLEEGNRLQDAMTCYGNQYLKFYTECGNQEVYLKCYAIVVAKDSSHGEEGFHQFRYYHCMPAEVFLRDFDSDNDTWFVKRPRTWSQAMTARYNGHEIYL